MGEVDRAVGVLLQKGARVDDPKDRQKALGLLARRGSVSYTHLRAHETVLDLVCRLLLEKKKKTRKQDHDSKDYTYNTKNA